MLSQALRDPPWVSFVLRQRAGLRAATFSLPPGHPRPTIAGMFDTISAELATAADKLAHLRRFL
jgi:hypothetical protein